MSSTQTSVFRDPRIMEDNAVVKSGLSAVTGLSKSMLMAELMTDPETYDRFDSAWRLAMRLLLSKDGKLCGDYGDIASQLGAVSKDSVRNWVKRLVEQKVIEVDQKGWQLTLTLLDKYMAIATAPDVIHDSIQVLPPEDRAVAALRKIADGAEELGGRIVLTIQDCTVGKRNGGKKA
jgi:hypothetical protein